MDTQLLYTEIIVRLGLAILAGIILGLNRWLHHKSAGIRTHTLVSVGAALALLLMSTITGGDAQAQSHVLQGTISGIGFLGAGVIVHQGASGNVRGLTTAASIWVVAIIGCCFGAGGGHGCRIGAGCGITPRVGDRFGAGGRLRDCWSFAYRCRACHRGGGGSGW